MKILTVAQMVTLEKATDAAGFSYDQMMAAAGGALAQTILEQGPFEGPVLCLIGPGNNGGDGLVACAHLQKAGVQAIPYIWKRKTAQDPLVAAVQNPLWAQQDTDYTHLRQLIARATVIVDALLGTGNTRSIGGSLAELLQTVHKVLAQRDAAPPARVDPAWPQPRPHPLIVACDCPSGLYNDTGEIDPLALSAGITVTFALPKRGHLLQPGATACGRLIIADIHIDRALAPADAPDLLTPAEVAALLPARPPSAHKGTFGKALIIAGSTHYPGAAALASIAAYRTGAGLVRLATPAGVGRLAASLAPEPVHTVLPANMGAITPDAVPILRPLFESQQALLVGPGLSTDPHTIAFVEDLLLGTKQHPSLGFLDTNAASSTAPALPPLIVDADALNALAQLKPGPGALPPHSILTPHPGEMSRLTGLRTAEINADRWGIAGRFAREWNQIVVLKGAYTVIAHPEGALAISPFAEAALATAGSGDVLAGAIVALLAQRLPPWDAARAGVYLHALAGRLAARHRGPALLASDIAHQLPQALARLRAL